MLKITPKIVKKMASYYSFNFSKHKRSKKKIKYLIYHYTGMKNDRLAIERLTNTRSKVSSHYYITLRGKIIQMVPDNYVAWHAGVSYWKNDKSLNLKSIGIEISNPGHQHGYLSFRKEQIKSLIKISRTLIKKYKIKKENILGHSDIAPLRKKDPGEKFPWENLAKYNLVWSHTLNLKKIKKFRKNKLPSKFEKKIFINNLYKIGYKRIEGSKFNKNIKYLTIAFQRRFRQGLVDGKIDKECLIISKNLISH